jgi:colanic acid/amylovoran biosynthesis glycosyltransferase
MVKKLFLITTSYPFGKGEPFIASEMKLLRNYFEGIEVVPVYFQNGRKNRDESLALNLNYAKTRWGRFRFVRMMFNFFVALFKYNWQSELLFVFQNEHKLINMMEMSRALYRAQLFDSFLKNSLINAHEQEASLIYFYCMIPEIMGAISFRKRTKSKIKIVSRAHGGDIYEDRHRGNYLGFRRYIADGIDAIYCISTDGLTYLRNRYISLENKCHDAKLGVFDPGFRNAQPDEDVISVISCSFIKKLKRVDLIIDSLDYIITTHPNVNIKWTHVGDGELFDEMRHYALERISTRAKVLFTGYLTESQIMNLYRDEPFDVFINVSTSEGLPVSLMEAASVGLPLIATDVGGTREIVDSKNGLLIPCDSSAEAIGSAVLRFKDKKWALTLRNQSRLLWNEKFNAVENHNMFCQELVNMLEPGF